jgi:hypothetical protein
MLWEFSDGEELSFPIPCQQMALCMIGEQVERLRMFSLNINLKFSVLIQEQIFGWVAQRAWGLWDIYSEGGWVSSFRIPTLCNQLLSHL